MPVTGITAPGAVISSGVATPAAGRELVFDDGLAGTSFGDPLLAISADGFGLTTLQSGALQWFNFALSRTQIAAYQFDLPFGPGHLRLMQRDGSGLGEMPVQGDVGLFIPFSFSPDGSQLAFVYTETGTSGKEGILISPVGSSSFTKVPLGSNDYTHILGQGTGGVEWSPDGGRFAYVAWPGANDPSLGGLAVRYCDTSGGGVTTVKAEATGIDWQLYDWFPDGTLLLGRVDRSSNTVQFYKVTLGGGSALIYTDTGGALTGGEHPGRRAAASRDGQRIAIAAADGLYVMPVTGGSPTRIYSGEVIFVKWGAPTGTPTTVVGGAWGGGLVKGDHSVLGATGGRQLQRRYSITELVLLARTALSNRAAAAIAAAIAMAESGGDPLATNTDGDGSEDRGLWQINNAAHPGVSDACAFYPPCCARAMATISANGTDFTPWTTYNSGAFEDFLPQAEAVP